MVVKPTKTSRKTKEIIGKKILYPLNIPNYSGISNFSDSDISMN